MLICEKKKCVGCGACYNICPSKAIKMTADEEGFLYPSINQSKCTKCGLCKNVCQANNLELTENTKRIVFAVKHSDEETRHKSTSGGMFSALADFIIKQGGVIYGVEFGKDFYVKHARATDSEGYSKFRGSKYVQSDIGHSYEKVKEDLSDGKHVLFTGTPCQIAGLNLYLKTYKNKEKLITCEVLCHGAPSPLMWKEHLTLIEKERKVKIIDYKNRSKVKGWNTHNEHAFYNNGKNEYKSKLLQNHKDLFYSHLIIRPSCFECKFAGAPSVADFTIADFWGIDLSINGFNDNKGTSLVILNTEKAQRVFEDIKGTLILRQSNIEDAFKDNHKTPAKWNINRPNFWKDYKAHGYLFVVKKYAGYSIRGRLKRSLKILAKNIAEKTGVYNFIHKFTAKKYEKETFK